MNSSMLSGAGSDAVGLLISAVGLGVVADGARLVGDLFAPGQQAFVVLEVADDGERDFGFLTFGG